MEKEAHRENIYTSKEATGVSWYAPHLETSMRMIEAAQLPKDASIIDIGGGASTLCDDLIDAGYRDVTILVVSSAALEKIRERLANKSGL